ncbi:MAG: hypothetical protein JSU08_02200 [Acidobacteria bacterium]|nr:hypothetical protein [Acidobacteriota bacterium]
MLLTLPWLSLALPDLTSAIEEQMRRAAAKFAAGESRTAVHLGGELACDDRGAPDAAEDVMRHANVSFQFVSGIETVDEARYATRDGSVVCVDHAARHVSFRLNRAVFDAPYSTWTDLFAAPLAATWRHHGCFPLHAAAVAFDDGTSVMVVGASGSGKTTTALALVTAGATWRADDKVLLHHAGAGLLATSLYANTNLAPQTIAAHPHLGFALARPPLNETNEKRACLLRELGQRVDLSPFAPSALLFPIRVTRHTSSFRPISTIDALLRLAEQSPTSGDRTVMRRQHELLVTLARRAPAWEIEAGSDVLIAPGSFARALRDAVSHHAVSASA